MKSFLSIPSVFLCLYFCISLGDVAYAAATNSFQVLNTTPVRSGDAMIIGLDQRLKYSVALVFRGKNIPVFNFNNRTVGIIPIPSTLPVDTYTIGVILGTGEQVFERVRVVPRPVKVISLPIPKKLSITPSQLVKDLEVKKVELGSTSPFYSPEPLFQIIFGLPLADNRTVSSYFGEIRKTGHKSIRHLGVDFVGAIGTSVYAINSGRIERVYLDSIYGKTIIIDHGAGIRSLYMHLNSTYGEKGLLVSRGQLIGTLGQTGYASAPHLHLSIKIHGESVDPLAFVRNFK